MSFHSKLVADAVWPADIRTALTLNAKAVSVGRRSQKIPGLKTEVMIIREEQVPLSRGGFESLRLHRYRLDIRTREGPSGDLSGKEQAAALDSALDTLTERYQGLQPFKATFPELVAVQVEERESDLDEARTDQLLGSLQVDFLLKEAA